MKNIFRKTVKKVRETAAKVSRTVKEHPEVAVLGVAAAVTGVVYAWAAHDSRKTVNWLNSTTETENTQPVMYGFTRKDAWVLSELGLCDGADDAKGGTVHMFYLTPEEKNRLEHVPFICKENPDA